MSYQQPPPGQYGNQPGYGAPVPQKTSVMSILALISGILGVCGAGCLIFGVGGIVLGILGKKEIRESQGAIKGQGLAQAGFILGIIGLVLGVGYWILVASGAIDATYSSS
jgi:hypothetical protein